MGVVWYCHCNRRMCVTGFLCRSTCLLIQLRQPTARCRRPRNASSHSIVGLHSAHSGQNQAPVVYISNSCLGKPSNHFNTLHAVTAHRSRYLFAPQPPDQRPSHYISMITRRGTKTSLPHRFTGSGGGAGASGAASPPADAAAIWGAEQAGEGALQVGRESADDSVEESEYSDSDDPKDKDWGAFLDRRLEQQQQEQQQPPPRRRSARREAARTKARLRNVIDPSTKPVRKVQGYYNTYVKDMPTRDRFQDWSLDFGGEVSYVARSHCDCRSFEHSAICYVVAVASYRDCNMLLQQPTSPCITE